MFLTRDNKIIFIQLIIILSFQTISQYSYAVEANSIASFGSISKSWQGTIIHIAVFVEFISAFSGFILVIAGLLQLKQEHAGQGGQQQQAVKVGFLYLIIGGMLLVLGSVVVLLANSVSPVEGGVTKGIEGIMHSGTVSEPINIYDGIIIYLLIPFLRLINIIGPVVGLITLCVGVHRLRYHSNPQMMSMYRRSPMATGFYFFVGAILLAPFYIIKALSGSLFKTPQILNKYCGGGSGEEFLSYFHTLHNNYILSFSGGTFQCVSVSSRSTSDNLLELAYALLFVVGFISFLRGIFLLTRLGEHMGGPDTSVSKIVAHIVAGVCAINANMFVEIMKHTYQLIINLKAS